MPAAPVPEDQVDTTFLQENKRTQSTATISGFAFKSQVHDLLIKIGGIGHEFRLTYATTSRGKNNTQYSHPFSLCKGHH